MKVKSIIMYGLLLLGVGAATTSCEDMFTAENKLVSTDLAPQDTVYQMMGIVKRMQKLADRTVLLGEIRADLVEVNNVVASTDLQQLYNNDIDTDNVYNKPGDYYDVINNCNIYLAYVDDQLKTHGSYYYAKEIMATKCFRAWCYLELAKIYGEVPFVLDPVLTPEKADEIVNSGNKAGLETILDFCIADLEEDLDKNPAINLEMRPDYGVTFWQEVSCDNFFLPVRAMLAELYLWRASYEEGKSGADAARYYYLQAINLYHEYFCFPKEERSVRTNTNSWTDRDHNSISISYFNRFSVGASSENVAIIPCDTAAYYGNVSNLRTVFNSQYTNNYYPWASPSATIRKISATQQNCYYDRNADEVIYFSLDPADYLQQSMVGDLRYYTVYRTDGNPASQDNGNYNPTRAWISKWTNGSLSFLTTDKKNDYIPLFRTSILYLHMAEALNRAGFPETAFAVLKYGLTQEVMDNRNIISQTEYDALCEIKTSRFGLEEPKYAIDELLKNKTSNSFVIWSSDVFYNPDNVNPKDYTKAPYDNMLAQIGIHSNGSGFAELNEKYYLPTDLSGIVPVPAKPAFMEEPAKPLEYEEWCALDPLLDPNDDITHLLYDYYLLNYGYDEKKAAYDEWCITYPKELAAYLDALATNAAWLASDYVRNQRIEELSKMILEEEALEGMFEGQRFYDLMRYQMRTGILQKNITLPAFVEEKYGVREGMNNRPWHLTLPTR